MSKDQNKPNVTADPVLNKLSRREREVFAMLLMGTTSNQIGLALRISSKTVETHRTNLNRKLATHRPDEMIRLAVGRGWLVANGAGGVRLTFDYQRSTWDGKYETVKAVVAGAA